MAKISAHGAVARVQLTASKAEEEPRLTRDGLAHLQLTVTSDGRVLRQISLRHPHRISRSSRKVIGRVPQAELRAASDEQLARYLARVAQRLGYTPDAENGSR